MPDVHTINVLFSDLSAFLFGRMQFWQHKHDIELGGVRDVIDGNDPNDLKGAPEVFWLVQNAMEITKQWQFYIRAINYKMSIQHVSALFGYQKAFTNGHGFGDPTDPRANFLLGEDLNSRLPKFPKVFTCGGSVLSGLESGGLFVPRMMNGNKSPLLKAGRTYPNTVDEINPNDYFYMPATHPWLFFAANNVKGSGSVFPFDNGAFYPWLENRPFTFMPHVSRFPINYPSSKLKKMSPGLNVPSPYYTANKVTINE